MTFQNVWTFDKTKAVDTAALLKINTERLINEIQKAAVGLYKTTPLLKDYKVALTECIEKILPSAFNHDITSWTPVSLATRYSKKHHKVQVVAFTDLKDQTSYTYNCCKN
jgi:hypothetical protein